MQDRVAAIERAEAQIEALKQDFLKALHRLRAAERGHEAREKRLDLIQEIHEAAVPYFSRVNKWVGESSILRAQDNPVWRLSLADHCYSVLNTYTEYWDFLGRESAVVEVDLQERYRSPDGAYALMQGIVRLNYPVRWRALRDRFADRGLPVRGFEDENVLERLRRSERMTTERWIGVVLGVLFIGVLLVLNVWIPNPTPTQEITFRIVLALGAGAVGAVLPGMLKLRGQLGGFAVRAAGALALFFIVYFWNPPGANDTREPEGSREVSFGASNADEPFSVKGSFEGTVVVRGGKLNVRVLEGTLTMPSAPPAGPVVYVRAVKLNLVRSAPQGAWEIVREGVPNAIERQLDEGAVISVSQFDEELDLTGLGSIADHWLVFDISLSAGRGDANIGLSHVHTRRDLLRGLAL